MYSSRGKETAKTDIMSFVSLMDTIKESGFFFSWYLWTLNRNFLPGVMPYEMNAKKCCETLTCMSNSWKVYAHAIW